MKILSYVSIASLGVLLSACGGDGNSGSKTLPRGAAALSGNYKASKASCDDSDAMVEQNLSMTLNLKMDDKTLELVGVQGDCTVTEVYNITNKSDQSLNVEFQSIAKVGTNEESCLGAKDLTDHRGGTLQYKTSGDVLRLTAPDGCIAFVADN